MQSTASNLTPAGQIPGVGSSGWFGFFFRPRYRVVRDDYSGFEVQRKLWWWPWWHQPEINTRGTVEGAEDWLRSYLTRQKAGHVVKHIQPNIAVSQPGTRPTNT